MKFDRNLDGRTRRKNTAKGDIAFLPADAPTMLRPATDDPHRVLSFSYLVFEPSYLAELALSNGIGRPLDFIPTFATPDPFLHEITAALTAAPRIKDPAANLFTETLLNAACARILPSVFLCDHEDFLPGCPGRSSKAQSSVLDLREDDHCRKNEKLFSKTSAQTVGQERGSFATLSNN
jgi:hypothetical protein